MNKVDYIVKTVGKKQWKMVWAGRWAPLAFLDWGKHYTTTMKFNGKPFMSEVIFVYHRGGVAAWMPEIEVERFGRYVVKKINGKFSIVKNICRNMERYGNEALRFMRKNKNKAITEKIFRTQLKMIRAYYYYHVQVKYSIDALPPRQLKQFLPALQASRVAAEPVFDMVITFDSSFIKQVHKKTGCAPQLIFCFTPDELAHYFKTGQIPSRQVLAKRFENSVFHFNRQGMRVYAGNEAVRLEGALAAALGDEIKGECAYPGIIQGNARIVLDPTKADHFIDGDILVTSMTRPDYLPLMHRAAGFVTDSGGILCHAAIVSREMKKPCIIGTKIATKVLRDGDRVEVDAEKGIVRKI